MFEAYKRQKIAAIHSYKVDPQVTPGFAAFLVGILVFMSVMLFGAGNILGGLIFGSILIPVYVFGPEWRRGKSESGQELR